MRTTRYVALACIALGVGIAALAHRPPSGRSYTFTTLAAGLQRRPNAWLGRTVALRARAVATCAGCRHEADLLEDLQSAHPPGPRTSIPLVIAPADNLTTLVRHIPLLGAVLVPAPRLPMTGTFHVRIERDPKAGSATSCMLWCYRAILGPPL